MRAVVALVALSSACTADQTGVRTNADEAEVIGGRNAPAGKWPDTAAVLYGGQQGCTGVLIAPTVALTAGHCNGDDLDAILVGTASLARSSEGETIKVTKRIEHPDSSATEDLMVLVLERASKFAPRAIATGWARLEIKNSARVAIVGYGATDADANNYIDELQEAETTIIDADCTEKPGCNQSVAPGGELGAGGMGIDTCPGDSGGPLYLVTDHGTFLAGITSRAYDDAVRPCGEGGIYGRPDKVIDWIEQSAGVAVTRGPEPEAEAIEAKRGGDGETTVIANDPKSESHTFAIAAPPARGTAKVREDGRVRVCVDPAAPAGSDALTVSVTDKDDAGRSVSVRIPITVEAGAESGACDVEDFEEGGGCCDGGRGASSLPLALGVVALVVGRPRRRRGVR